MVLFRRLLGYGGLRSSRHSENVFFCRKVLLPLYRVRGTRRFPVLWHDFVNRTIP